jgi:hypothetical protein
MKKKDSVFIELHTNIDEDFIDTYTLLLYCIFYLVVIRQYNCLYVKNLNIKLNIYILTI